MTAILAAGAAQAQEGAQPEALDLSEAATPMAVYAAMAKLEANVAEAGGAVMLAAASGGADAVRGEAMADFQSDAGQIDHYVTALEGMDLSRGERETLDTFKAQWRESAPLGRALIENADGSDMVREQALEWWQSLDTLDATLDAQLKATLEARRDDSSG